ncbi:alpha-L-rhamnosidase-related protein [Mucilaginibacter mali]|uniref:alpha-L-rhamnosidase-related protein n=1 Tax=Mucilaginibacter mali TaxID=2740462 RepID=UPI00191DF553|nr:alpha-L-rhamnosidase C-terminal domain-containing protein [Mucilaginibacter mali]
MLFIFTLVYQAKAQMKDSKITTPVTTWNADWIGCPGVNLKEYGVYHLRKTFELAAKPGTFVVHVSGDQRYRLFVNGTPVCFGPARGDLRNWNYETIDIAPWLKVGKNVLAAQLWHMGGGAPAAQVSAQTGFILQGNGDNEQLVNTGSTWRIIKNEGYFAEPFPASRLASYIVGSCDSVIFKNYPLNWQNPDYDDKNWLTPVSEAKARYYTEKRILKPRAIPMMEETPEPITGIARVQGMDQATIVKAFDSNGTVYIPANTTATILFDRETLTTAYPEITFSQGSDSKVKITYAESLFDSKGLKGNRNEIAGKSIKGYYDVFMPDGGTGRLFRPLWTRTFRYLQFDITTGSQPLVLDRLQSVFTAYPFKENAVFTSNDKSLTDIWTASWRTARLCANETYMDCPYYEQLQYVGDTRIQALISLYVSGDDRLMRNAIEQFHQSQIPDGLTMDAYPAGGGKFIPPFSLFWISMLHDYSRYRDDYPFVDRYLVPMEAILQWFQHRIDPRTGMLGQLPFWNFVDWSFTFKGIPPGGMDGNSAILSLQYVYTLQQAAQLYAQAGQAQKAAQYSKLALQIRQAVYRNCYDAGKKLLADSPEKRSFSQHANIWSILTDCIPGKDQPATMQQIIADRSLIGTSLYYRFYYARALKKAGMGNLYISTLQPWKDMLAQGFSTFPETLEPNVRSDCHAWSASPCYDFLSTICGIDTDAPGFNKVLIAPNPGSLTDISGTMPHPKGQIKVSYKKQPDGGYLAKVELPPNLTGRFVAKGKVIALKAGIQTFTFYK